MATTHIGTRTLRLLRRAADFALMVFLALFLATVGAGAAVMPLKKATEVHHLLGAATAVVVLAGVVALLVWIKRMPFTSRDFGKYPRLGLAANLLLVSLWATYALGALSVSMHKAGWATYTLDESRHVPAGASHERVLEGAILDTYAWHVADAIPVVKVWELWDVAAPAKPSSFASRGLLFLFRGVLLAQMVGLLLQKKWSFRGQLAVVTAGAAAARGDLELVHDQAVDAADSTDVLPYRIDARLEKARYLTGAGRAAEAKEVLDEARKLVDEEAALHDLAARRRRLEELEAGLRTGKETPRETGG